MPRTQALVKAQKKYAEKNMENILKQRKESGSQQRANNNYYMKCRTMILAFRELCNMVKTLTESDSLEWGLKD